MSKLLTRAATFAVLTLAPMSGWATIMESGGGFTILDNMTGTSTISVTDNELVDSLFVTLDIAHTFVGNLTISLTGPGGTASIMERTGRIGINAGAAADLGTYNYIAGPPIFISTTTYTFEDGGADWWAAAAGTSAFAGIPTGTYAASGFEDLVPVSLDTTFGGTTTLGDWTLSIEDAQSPNEGILAGWSIEITTFCDVNPTDQSCITPPGPGPGPGVPVPGTLLLLLAGLAGLRIGNREHG